MEIDITENKNMYLDLHISLITTIGELHIAFLTIYMRTSLGLGVNEKNKYQKNSFLYL